MDRRNEGRKDGRTDGRTLFYRTLPAEVGRPIIGQEITVFRKILHLSTKWMSSFQNF